jgi:Putative DNA-binding domain
VFVAFYEMIFKEGMTPVPDNKIMVALHDLTNRIEIGQKHIRGEDRQNNIRVTKGLLRDHFVAADVSALSHGPGMIFDFENSIRRSRTETARYEFKQGLLRLDTTRQIDSTIITKILETICAISNVGPDADGFLYIGIADKAADAQRIHDLDGIEPIKFDHVEIVGIDREAKQLGLAIDKYMRLLEDGISKSTLTEPLKTNLLTSLDLISYKGLQVIRIRVPRQTQPTFLDDECFLRVGSSTKKATGPQIAAASKLFTQK